MGLAEFIIATNIIQPNRCHCMQSNCTCDNIFIHNQYTPSFFKLQNSVVFLNVDFCHYFLLFILMEFQKGILVVRVESEHLLGHIMNL
jgi:hypothetical protein